MEAGIRQTWRERKTDSSASIFKLYKRVAAILLFHFIAYVANTIDAGYVFTCYRGERCRWNLYCTEKCLLLIFSSIA